MVFEARRKHVAGAVTQSVGDQNDGPVVNLSKTIDDFWRRKWNSFGILRARFDRLRDGIFPVRHILVLLGQRQRRRRIDELCRLGGDYSGGQQLENEFRCDDVAAAVATDINNKAFWRKLSVE